MKAMPFDPHEDEDCDSHPSSLSHDSIDEISSHSLSSQWSDSRSSPLPSARSSPDKKAGLD